MSDSGDSPNPLQNLLGDLLKVVGGSTGGSPAWWEAARSLAHGVAIEGSEDANADPLERIRLGDLARVVELHVGEHTGLATGHGGEPIRFSATDRGTWALRTLEAWRPYLDAMVSAQERATAAPGALPADLGLGGEAEGLQDLLGRFALTMGPVLLGLQFGSTAGHLARRALGQYAVPVPWPEGNELLVVPRNIAAFAEDWSLPSQETELWVCIRELTAHSVLRLPHVSARIRHLLADAAHEAVGFQQEITERLTGEAGDAEALQHLMTDPESLLADLMTPGARPGSAQLTAVVTALGGYVDHVTAAIAARLTGSGPVLTEAWYRYRVADAKGEGAAAALFGLDVGRQQVDRGAAFVRGVVERAGEEGLSRLWRSERTLPTPAELDAPGLWLERINLPEDGDPPENGGQAGGGGPDPLPPQTP